MPIDDIWSSLVEVMAYNLFGAKLPPIPMLTPVKF